MLSLDSVPPSLCLKSSPEKFAELCEQEGIKPAPYVGRYKWALLERLDVLSDEELRDLVRQSYEMVVGKSKTKAKAKGAKTKTQKTARKRARRQPSR